MNKDSYKTISLCMIVRNEACNLDACLENIRKVVNEIIFVDTGSTDQTLLKCRQYSNKIYQSPWEDDFSKARNVSLDQATGDWILWIDGDDRLDAEECLKIRELTKYPLDRGFAFNIIDKNKMGQVSDVFQQTRFFPNHPRLRFRRRVHEQISLSLDELHFKTIFVNNIYITHTGYRDKGVDKLKAVRNKRLMEMEMDEWGHEPTVRYMYAGCFESLEDYPRAIQEYRTAFQLAGQGNLQSHVRRFAPLKIAECYWKAKNYIEAEEWAGKALSENSEQAIAYAIRGGIDYLKGDLNRAEKNFLKVIAMEIKPGLIPQNTYLVKKKAFVHLQNIYRQSGQWEKLLLILERHLDFDPQSGERYASLGDVWRKLGRTAESERLSRKAGKNAGVLVESGSPSV